MNEQAILDAYNLFVQNGYKKSIDEYKKLIASNPEALTDSYNLFAGQGYSKSIDDFKSLMGLTQAPVKKKEQAVPSVQPATVSPSAGGSLVSPKIEEEIIVGPMGMTGLQKKTEKPKEEPPKKDGQGLLLNVVSSLDRGFYKNFIGNPIKGLGTLLEQGTAKLTGGSGKAPISNALIKFGDYFNKTIDELAPQDEEFKGTLTDQFGQAFGQVASLITTGAVGAIGKGAGAAATAQAAVAAQAAPKAVTALSAAKGLAGELASPTAISAGLSMGQSEFDRAKEAGATDDQAFEAFYKNAAVGSILEKIPVMQFMKRFNQASAGGLANYIKTKGVAGLTGGVEEMTTEVLQQLYANKTAQDIYNINQDLFEGVGESGGVGFGVGFLLNAMGANAKLLRQQGKEQEAAMVEAQAKELEDRSGKGGPSSYAINGINIQPIPLTDGGTITPRDIVGTMIESMSAADLAKVNIEITNDPELRIKLQDKIVTSSIKEQVRESNPNLTEEQLDEVTNLEKELKKFEGNTTQSGKDRAAEIRTQIKTIQQDAIQKQAAGEVPVQPTPGVSEEVEGRKPTAEPEVVTEEGVTPEVAKEKVNVVLSLDGKPIESKEQIDAINSVIEERIPNLQNVEGAPKMLQDLGIKLSDNVQESFNQFVQDKIEGKTQDTFAEWVQKSQEPIAESLRDVESTTKALESEVEKGLKFNANFNLPLEMLTPEKVSEAYHKAKADGSNPELVNAVEKTIYETLPIERIQPEPGTVRPEAKEATIPTGLAVPSQPSPKREEVKSSLQRIANAGLLRSAETGQPAITQQEIDVQMALTDAMARVWEETTGNNNFYETFIEDVKEGDIEAIKEKGGALFQNVELPQRPLSRVTLAVFELPEFQKMSGNMVAPQSVSDLMKSRGKQIEKEIINTVLSYDKYSGQKRIPFDEFRDDVETQLMKLERIDTKTYASYGKDNLGDNHEYGQTQTIIFNSPIDHGQHGHFGGDFYSSNLTTKKWDIRQIPNTEQYVAIDADMPSGVSQNEIAQYVGTAGPRADVEKWVQDRTNERDREINKGLFGHIRNWYNSNTGVYTLAELQSDYFQKNKANDLYASRIPREEVDEYVNKNFRAKLNKEVVDLIKDEFGIKTSFERKEDGSVRVEARTKSDNNLVGSATATRAKAGYTIEEEAENEAVVEGSRVLANIDENIAKRRREIIDDYKSKRDAIKGEESKYIAKRIEEIKKSEEGNLMLRQFVASQKVHELRLFRESLKHAADKGATELWFPTPFTIANIEGYVSASGNAPYEVVSGDENSLDVGDIINYGGTDMIVVEANSYSIIVAPKDEVSVYEIDELRDGEVQNRMDELEYDLKRQVNDINNITKEEAEAYTTDEFLSEDILKQLNAYFEENPEEETVAWRLIEDDVRDSVSDYYDSMSVEDLVGWASEVYMEGEMVYAVENRRSTVRFGQPDEYDSGANEDNFENDLSEEQYTVVKKYEELGDMIRKMRPDAVEVTDNNGKKWIKIDITEADATNPIIAFQEEGGKIKGAIDFSNDSRASIYIFDGADISTLAHEATGHLGRRMLERLAQVDEGFAKDYEAAKRWAGVKDNQWSRGAEEKFARGFERYLVEGKSPSAALKSVFEKLKTWLSNIYKTITGSSIDIELTPEINRVFGNLIATKSEQLMTANTKDATVLERVRDFLDKAEADLDKFGRETAGMNIAVPVMKAIIKTVRALVNTGITLQEAIQRAAAERNVSEQDVIDTINLLAQQREQQAKPQGVSEVELPGYNRMMRELEGVIEKSEQRGVSEEKTMQNAIDYLQGSKVYEDASDTQREKMVRDVRKMFGKREKAAPKPEKLFGEAKDVNMITMSEYDLLKKQLADTAKGAKNAKAVWVKTSQALTKYLKQMVDGGHVTTKQVAAILRKFSGVNMFDENSIGRFVDYMAKVFKNANYAEQIAQINSMLPVARKNAQTKVGVAETLTPMLKKLFAINPTLIPESVFDEYAEVVSMIGESKAVLQLEESGKLTDKVNKILDAVDAEVSKSEELAELFDAYPNKLVDEDGKVDFAGTIKQMLEEEVITDEEAQIMRKYKKNILPMVEREGKSEAELEAEKEVLVGAVQDADVDSDGLSMKDERDKARELAKLIKTDAVKGLDNAQLKNLLRVIDNINNGYFPHYAQLMVEKLNDINNAKVLDESIKTAKPLKLSSVYSKLKSLLTKKEKFSELIRRNPLFYIDQVFGDFKTKNIFNSLFEKAADAQAQFQKAITDLNNKLQEAEDAVAKSFKYDANKTLMSKFKMMTFMVQLENDSNPDNRTVNPAAEYLKKTIEHIENGKSSFGKRDAEMLQQILDEYADADGNIDSEKLYNSFNAAEKKAIKTIQDINSGIRDKAIFTAAVIRGDKIHPLNNYVHLNVLHEYKPDEAISGVAFVDTYNNSLRPSTKAKSLIARTGKVAPLNFDVFASANRGAKYTLMDYYLTEPIRTARKTLNETSSMMKERKADKQQREIFNAIDRAFEESVENLLTDNFISTSVIDDAVNFMSKQGYRAVLASLPRFAGELSSNIAFAMIAAPNDFKTGVKNKGVVLSPNASNIMSNVGSKQTNRLFPNDTLSGRLVDTSVMNQASGVRGGRAQNDVANKIQQIYNLSLKKYQNAVELMADALISTPDKMVMRPMWFGSFANEFKRLTGKDVDFDKVQANDEIYMASNKEALDAARIIADEKTVLTGASDNAFMGILKGTPKPNQSAFIRGFNIFNNFMTRFLIYEYVTARTGIMAAMGNGSISRKQGVALLSAVATRMTLYTLITTMLSEGLVSLFVDGEDDEDEKSLMQKAGQAMSSSATAMLVGRDFGNATKSLLNYGVERMNEKYLDFLREGEYDPYKDALQYTIIPPDTKGKKTDAGDLIMNMLGPFGPSAKTLDLAIRKATEPPKKEGDAISRSEKEKTIRIPLEFLGNLGMIPLYKDVRKIVNTELYKDLDKGEKKPPMNKIGKEDMKKYFPQMYNELYGPGGTLYDIELMKKEMRKEKERIRKEMKDEMYR
jgi:hypothetical protein